MPQMERRQSLGAAASQGFALVSDTHLNPAAPERTTWMRDVFAAIVDRDPAFVLHCGDLTDYGSPEQLELYASTIPDALADKIVHIPGNHELRWDRAAGETYAHHFGWGPKSFDSSGIHVVAPSPVMLLQEPAHPSAEILEWLDDDLSRATVPTLLFQHHPIGADYYYSDRQDRFLEIVSGRIRGLFAGHAHAQRVQRMNGFVQVVFDALRKRPTYYWAERSADELTITRIDLDTDTTAPVTTIPLYGAGPAAELKPSRLTIGADGSVDASFDTEPETVGVQVLDETGWSATIERPFTDHIDLSSLTLGEHQVRVRASQADEWWDSVRTIQVPGGPKELWRRELPGAIQAALTTADEQIIAATTRGVLAAFDADGTELWTTTLGPIYREPAIDAASIYVPSADHTLTALDRHTRQQRWQVTTDEPVLSTPLVADDRVLCAAGGTLLCLDALSGKQMWATEIGGFSAGRPATDGTRVYVGAGDGRAHAFDAATGEARWTFVTRDTADPYQALLYGPWDDRMLVVPDGLVIVSAVDATSAVNRATGESIWEVTGAAMYSSPRLVHMDRTAYVLIVQERGATGHVVRKSGDRYGRNSAYGRRSVRSTAPFLTCLVDAHTGAERWRLDLGFPVLNSGAAIDGETAWVLGANSNLARINLRAGTVDSVVKLGSSYTFSTPIVLGDKVIAADQSGVLRAVDAG